MISEEAMPAAQPFKHNGGGIAGGRGGDGGFHGGGGNVGGEGGDVGGEGGVNMQMHW